MEGVAPSGAPSRGRTDGRSAGRQDQGEGALDHPGLPAPRLGEARAGAASLRDRQPHGEPRGQDALLAGRRVARVQVGVRGCAQRISPSREWRGEPQDLGEGDPGGR
eukprot:7645539-Alexandrium_andersonii.AAC.1